MRKSCSYKGWYSLANILTIAGSYAQNITINGNVRNSVTRKERRLWTVVIKGTEYGTFADDKVTSNSVKSPAGYNCWYPPLDMTAGGYGIQRLQDYFGWFCSEQCARPEMVVAANCVPQRILESLIHRKDQRRQYRNSPIPTITMWLPL